MESEFILAMINGCLLVADFLHMGHLSNRQARDKISELDIAGTSIAYLVCQFLAFGR